MILRIHLEEEEYSLDSKFKNFKSDERKLSYQSCVVAQIK